MRSHNGSSATCSWKAATPNSGSALSRVLKAWMLAFVKSLFLDLVRWDATKLRDALRGINVPTLVLQSTYMDANLKRVSLSTGMTTPWMDAVASLVQKSQARVIPNAGHLTMIEAAQAVNNAIQEFAGHVA